MRDSYYTKECMAAIKPYITGKADTCSYCDHLSPLILQEGLYTYITLAIGQIVEGYLQICAQKHRTAATGLHKHETNELIKMKRLVRDTFEKVYGNRGIAFEHGKAGACLWGTNHVKNSYDLCHHAHIHFVPVAIDIRDRIKEYLPTEIVVASMCELKEFRQDELREESYLYYEDVNEIGYIYPVDDDAKIPRQFLRTNLAEELGMPERADWLRFPGKRYFESGKNKLQPVLQRLYKKMVTNE